MRILIVDSSRAFHQIIRSQMEPLGHIVEAATSADQTKEILNSGHFDLIALPRNVDGRDYTSLLNWIRGKTPYQFTPIVLVSSDVDTALVTEALTNGITEVLHRANPERLIKDLHRSLKHAHFDLNCDILLVEDSPTSGRLYKHMLETAGATVEWVQNSEGAREQLDNSLFDVILVDLVLDDASSGLEVMHYIQHHTSEEVSKTAVIAMTGFHDPSKRVLSFRLGADDYIIKPFPEEELLIRVEHLLKRQQLVDQLQRRESELTAMALFDALTGVYNRHGAMEMMNKHIHNCQRHNIDASLLILDLDNFKTLNDTYGHPYGDTILKNVGQGLNETVRREDVAGRWGGDEFVVFLSHCDAEAATNIADRLAQRLNRKDSNIHCSIGITKLREDDSLSSLLDRADKALYNTKKENKGGTSVI